MKLQLDRLCRKNLSIVNLLTDILKLQTQSSLKFRTSPNFLLQLSPSRSFCHQRPLQPSFCKAHVICKLDEDSQKELPVLQKVNFSQHTWLTQRESLFDLAAF